MSSRDQSNEPLAWKLRNAAIDRTDHEAARVDDFVLDADGVLDLRDLDRDPAGTSIADPAKALATIRGQLGDAHEVGHLYDETDEDKPRWRLGLRARQSDAAGAAPVGPDDLVAATLAPVKPMPPLSRLSMVPLATEDAEPAPEPRPDPISPVTPAPLSLAEAIEPEIDVRDERRPTANCPKCMGLGRRDLFDRFSRVEFYSCDNCMHMWQQNVD